MSQTGRLRQGQTQRQWWLRDGGGCGQPGGSALGWDGEMMRGRSRERDSGKKALAFSLHPFGPWMLPANLFVELVDMLAKPLSLALRLYGNLYAGELLFLLIAAMLGAWQLPAHFVWAVFHLLVIPLQAFVFMMLTIVYLNAAHEKPHH